MKKTIIGSGIYNLDTIVVRDYPEWPRLRPFTDNVVLEEVGGTCGNVMCILAWMGWDAKPLACLDDSPEGLKITEDLKRYGCDCRYVTNTPNGGTTLLRCTHKKTADGEHVMSVRAGSPGGSRFPKRHFLRVRDEAPAFLDSLEEAPDVFFFDDPSAGNRLIAKGLRERGSLIYFEPSRLASKTDFEAVAVSDIVKFSDENIPDVSFADAYPDKVFIQTMGSKGVRYKLKDQPWVVVDAGTPGCVVDTEGAGDWFTAAFINELSELDDIYYFIDHAIYAAREQAIQSIAFLGSKGYIHTSQSLIVEGAEECPWCIPIINDIAKLLSDEALMELGKKLYVGYYDLDTICLTKEKPVSDDDWHEDYGIRTWDISENGKIRWSLFKIIDDPDGSSHGEELCSGSTDCSKYTK